MPNTPSLKLSTCGLLLCLFFTRYDKNHPSTVTLEAFEGAQMEPHVFREQLKRVRISMN